MRILCIYSDSGTSGTELPIPPLEALRIWADSHRYILEAIQAGSFQPCRGCFGCWLKTPGRCVIPGDGWEKLIRSFVASDLVVLLGETPYGCFDPAIKAVLDRWLPTLLPYVRRYRGEMHHVPRYRKRPRIVSASVGTGGAPSAIEGDASWLAAEDAIHLELARSFCDDAACPRQKRFFRYGGDPLPLASWLDEELAS